MMRETEGGGNGSGDDLAWVCATSRDDVIVCIGEAEVTGATGVMRRLVPPWQVSRVDDDQWVMDSVWTCAREQLLSSPTVGTFLPRPVSVVEVEACSPHKDVRSGQWTWLMAFPLAIIFSLLLVSIAVQDFAVIGTTSSEVTQILLPVDQSVTHGVDVDQFKPASVWDVIAGKLGRIISVSNFDPGKSCRSAGNQSRPRVRPQYVPPQERSDADSAELQELLQPASVQHSFRRSNAGLLSDLIAQANQGVRVQLQKQEDLSRKTSAAVGQDQVPELRRLTSLPNNTCSDASQEISQDGNPVCDERLVHIAMTLDANYLRGSVAAIYSILLHAECSNNIRFHFVVTKGKEGLEKVLVEKLPSLQFQTYTFDESSVKSLISNSVRHALEEPLNYARFYLAHMVDPCVKRIIYLDSDVLVLDRIEELWTTNMGNSTVGTPEYCNASFPSYFTENFWTNSSLASLFANKRPCYFNSGMMLINLERWRKTECTAVLEHWMKVQKEQHIYKLGSLPPLLLAFAGDIQAIDLRWNQHGLGGDIHKGDCRPTRNERASLLHWSGGGKPWQRLDTNQPCPVDQIWAPYDLLKPKTLH